MTQQEEDRLYREEWRNRFIAMGIGAVLGILVAAIEQFVWHIFLD